MAEKKPALWKRVLGYTLFSFAALVAAFFLSFPYDALKERVRLEADTAGYFVRIDRIGPGFFAVTAKDVQVSKKVEGDTPPEPLKLDSVTVGPTLFPPGLGVTIKALGGTTSAKLLGFTGSRVKLDVDDVDLSKGNLKGFSGLDLSGGVEAHVDLTIPRTTTGATPAEPDLGQASGTVALDLKNVTLNGGTMNLTIAQFGPEPTPVDLPKVSFGDITGRLKFEKGAGAVEEFKGKSSDLEVAVTGTLKLAKRIEYAEPALEVRFKADPDFSKRLGMIGGALSIVGPDPKDPSWRLGRLTGYLGRPQFH
jgi:type II secretion system protein N